MKFINRQKEIIRLNHLLKSGKASVGVIWGRRRLGKSRLLREWVQKHKGIYYVADESTSSIQRKYFSVAIEPILSGFSEVEYPDWTSLFSRLAKDAKEANWKGPLVIDELPYLIESASELPSVLQKFIDIEAKNAQLTLILCGSSQRMMQGAILDSSAPLYGRADEILKLSPISIGYMGKALNLKKPRKIIETFSIWGGVPRYWELVEKTKGEFHELIERIALDPMGPLNDEPSRLLLEDSAMNLRPILDAIGLGAHRLTEIAARIGQPVTSLMRPIQRLIELDILQRENPFGMDEANSKKTLYKIKDHFLRFWFEVVAPKRSLFSQATPSIRIQWLKNSLPTLFSITWEELCRLSVPSLFRSRNQEMGLAGRFWHGQGPEWDILAQSFDRNTLLVGEAKWCEKKMLPRAIYKNIEELRKKGIPPIFRKPNMHVIYALFIPEKPNQIRLPADVKVIDAKAVIHSLL
jgi:AAA+ ATPase superfamily predicted ATPase